MSEWLTVDILLVALAVSVYALWAQRAATAVARMQLEQLSKQETGRHRAKLTLHLEKTAARKWKFVVTNISEVDAQDVELKLVGINERPSPFFWNKYRKTILVAKLPRKSTTTLVPLCNGRDPRALKAVLTWKNTDGSEGSEERGRTWSMQHASVEDALR
jgi:hypothetical protein